MCAPSIMQKALAGLSRRELLHLGLSATAGTALASAGRIASAASRNAVSSIPTANMIDLSHVLSHEFPVIPVPGITFPFKMTEVASLDGPLHVHAYKWELIEHNGTHIDAPNHFIAGGKGIDEAMPVRNMIIPLAVIDLSERAKKDVDAALTVDDIMVWEKRHGRLPDRAAVMMYSGWDIKTGDPSQFLNMDDTHTMHFPGFSVEACEFLRDERVISGIGVDTISFDIGVDKEYRAHKAWLRGGGWALECVNNLGHVPPSGATIFVGAPRVEGATAAPARVIASWA